MRIVIVQKTFREGIAGPARGVFVRVFTNPGAVCSRYQPPTFVRRKMPSNARIENQRMAGCPHGTMIKAASSGPNDVPRFPPT